MNQTSSEPAEAAGLGHRLRELRSQRGMSVRSLAERAGFSPSFISQVETGQASPSIASLARIAEAVGVSLADFFGQRGRPATVVRADQRPELTSDWSRAVIEALGAPGGPAGLDAVIITLRGGGRSGSKLHAHPLPQLAFVVRGYVHLLLGEEHFELTTGDSVTIRAREPHAWENPGIAESELLIASPLYPSR